MKHMAFVVACIAVFSFFVANCGGGLATSSGKTLVSVNGKKITEGDVDFLGTVNPRIKAQLASPMGKKRILDNLVEQELLYQEAVKKGINRDPEVRAKAELYRRVIVAQSLLDNELEQAAKKYYEENPDEFKNLKMSQIVIRYDANPPKGKKAKGMHTEKQALSIANDVKARLEKGEDFAKVAAEVSEDMATKRRGGDMGLVAKDDKRFEARGYGPLVEKAYEMKVDEVSGPIKTENGYHIIKVTRGVELESFDDAKPAIEFKIKGKLKDDTVARLKKEGSVTFADELKPKKPESPAAEGAKPTLQITPAAPASPETPETPGPTPEAKKE
jgi:peptidyl-prolyl cis-trans isomerase C